MMALSQSSYFGKPFILAFIWNLVFRLSVHYNMVKGWWRVWKPFTNP